MWLECSFVIDSITENAKVSVPLGIAVFKPTYMHIHMAREKGNVTSKIKSDGLNPLDHLEHVLHCTLHLL